MKKKENSNFDYLSRASLVVQIVKKLPTMQET